MPALAVHSASLRSVPASLPLHLSEWRSFHRGVPTASMLPDHKCLEDPDVRRASAVENTVLPQAFALALQSWGCALWRLRFARRRTERQLFQSIERSDSASIPPRLWLQRLLTPLAVHQLFNKFHTLEIHQLRVFLLTPVQRHAHFPWTCEDLRIFDGRFVRDHVRTRACIALNDMQLVAMEIAGSIEPTLIVEPSYIDDERLAFPMRYRLSHPRVDRRRARILDK